MERKLELPSLGRIKRVSGWQITVFYYLRVLERKRGPTAWPQWSGDRLVHQSRKNFLCLELPTTEGAAFGSNAIPQAPVPGGVQAETD